MDPGGPPAAKRAPSRSVPVQSIGDREAPIGQSGERRPALPVQVWRFLLLLGSRVRSTHGNRVASPVPIAALAAPVLLSAERRSGAAAAAPALSPCRNPHLARPASLRNERPGRCLDCDDRRWACAPRIPCAARDCRTAGNEPERAPLPEALSAHPRQPPKSAGVIVNPRMQLEATISGILHKKKGGGWDILVP